MFHWQRSVDKGTKPADDLAVQLMRRRWAGDDISEYVDHPDWIVRREVALSEQISARVAERLVRDPEIRVVEAALRHPKLPHKAVADLAASDDPVLRDCLVRSRPEIPTDILAKLASDAHSSIRLHVAEHPDVTPEILGKLAHDDSWPVRRNVARHAQTPQDFMNVLADDQNMGVQYAVARNHKTSGKILDRMLRRPHAPAELHQKILAHPNLSETSAEYMLTCAKKDPSGDHTDWIYVFACNNACSAAMWHDMLDCLEDKNTVSDLIQATQNRNDLPADVLEHAALRTNDYCADQPYDHDLGVMSQSVLSHPNTTGEILHMLAEPARIGYTNSVNRTDHELLRHRLANSAVYASALPPDSIKKILAGEAQMSWNMKEGKRHTLNLLKDSVTQSQNVLPEYLADALMESISSDNQNTSPDIDSAKDMRSPDILARLAAHENVDMQMLAAESPYTPADQLALLASDIDETVRAFVASNKGTPSEVLVLLATDSESDVRDEATRQLLERGASERRNGGSLSSAGL